MPASRNSDRLRSIKRLDQLVAYLRDELDWPVESDDVEDISFSYEPDELGLDAEHAAKINQIKQIRPLDSRQPWGIFWVSFEKKRLPVVVLRRILGSLVVKSRQTANSADRPRWRMNDLLFISAYQKIVVALAETIRLMSEIDTVIAAHGGWPLKCMRTSCPTRSPLRLPSVCRCGPSRA